MECNYRVYGETNSWLGFHEDKENFSRRAVFSPLTSRCLRSFEFSSHGNCRPHFCGPVSDKVNILAAPRSLLVAAYICVHTCTGWRYASVNIVEKCIKGKHMHSKEGSSYVPPPSQPPPPTNLLRPSRHTSTYSYEPADTFANLRPNLLFHPYTTCSLSNVHVWSIISLLSSSRIERLSMFAAVSKGRRFFRLSKFWWWFCCVPSWRFNWNK